MASGKRKSFYTSDELLVLQRAFDLACADLQLEPARPGPRAHLGALIFEIAASGEDDCGELRRQSVQRFRDILGAPPIAASPGAVLTFAAMRGNPSRPPTKR